MRAGSMLWDLLTPPSYLFVRSGKKSHKQGNKSRPPACPPLLCPPLPVQNFLTCFTIPTQAAPPNQLVTLVLYGRRCRAYRPDLLLPSSSLEVPPRPKVEWSEGVIEKRDGRRRRRRRRRQSQLWLVEEAFSHLPPCSASLKMDGRKGVEGRDEREVTV